MIKKNIYLMYAITFLQGMVFYGSIATLYRQVNGVSIFQITMIESISIVLCLALELPWGIAADKIGYKKAMVICSVLFFVSKIVFWQATSFLGFLMERIILSVVLSGLSGVDTNILFLSCPEDKSHHIFGIYNSLGSAGILIASLAFTSFFSTNYRLSAFLTIIPYGIAALLSMLLREVKNTKSLKTSDSTHEFTNILNSIFKNKRLLLFIVGIALFNETHQTITVFLNQLQFVKCGMSEGFIGFVFVLVNIAGLSSLLSSPITKIIGAKKIIPICFLVAIFACFLMAMNSLAFISIFAILILRIAFSILEPLQSKLLNIQVEFTNRATTLSVFAIIMNSVGIMTNLILGAVAEINIAYAFYCGAAFCFVGMILTNIWAKKAK